MITEGILGRERRLARRAVTGPDEAVLAALDPDTRPGAPGTPW